MSICNCALGILRCDELEYSVDVSGPILLRLVGEVRASLRIVRRSVYFGGLFYVDCLLIILNFVIGCGGHCFYSDYCFWFPGFSYCA